MQVSDLGWLFPVIISIFIDNRNSPRYVIFPGQNILNNKNTANSKQRQPMRTVLSFLFAFFLLLTASCNRIPPKTHIIYDGWGVPHIYASSDTALFRAIGYSQMEHHAGLILKLYGTARGKAAEYWGPGFLGSDRLIWKAYVPDIAKKWARAQEPGFASLLESFVSGMNEYAARHPEQVPDSLKQVLPVSVEDVMAHAYRTVQLSFVAGATERTVRQWKNQREAGSNAWAIAPSRSESGNALLLINPHLPWEGPYTWFEMHLNAPGIHSYGAALVGFPVITVGFNDHLGWTHTVNVSDGWDVYELKLQGKGYLYNGKVFPFESDTVRLNIKHAGGKVAEYPLVRKRSVHGPVMEESGDRALAVRIVGDDKPLMAEQYWKMIRSRTLHEFTQCLAELHIPTFNVIYADRDGNIMYWLGGQVPRRKTGDRNTWQGIVPGDTSLYMWDGYHAWDELPLVVNPATGWVQNANDPPWFATFPGGPAPDSFPAYMSGRGLSFRAQRSATMLMDDHSVSFEEMVIYKHSTRSLLADRIMDDMEMLDLSHRSDSVYKAMEILAFWDHFTEHDSRGAVLFDRWVNLMGNRLFDIPWDERYPFTTPDRLRDTELALDALERAYLDILSSAGDPSVAWGDLYRLRMGDKDYPSNGGPGYLGIFRVMNYLPEFDGKFRQYHGDSFVAAVEFADEPRAEVALYYGNASQPGHPHRGNQLELFRDKRLRPALLKRKEVKKAAVRTVFPDE